MTKRFGVVMGLSMGMVLFCRASSEWDDVKIIQVNTEPPHASLMVYPDASTALSGDRAQSRWFLTLNGLWAFNWAQNPASRPEEFYKPEFDVSQWNEIEVPSNWQLKGYGTAVYKNTGLIFPKNPPRAPLDVNPVGSYRREFEISEEWAGRQVRIHFEGVNAAFYLWINGEKVGYSQDSRTPAEWNITPYIKPGKNIAAVEVYSFCDGSYLEDMDFWRLHGIFRDVFLFSTSVQHIRDYVVTTDLDNEYSNAVLRVDAEVLNPSGTLEISLLGADGREVVSSRKMSANQTAFEVPVKNPLKWNAETPNLYTLLMTLKDKEGQVVEVIPQQVGFRKVELRGEAFLINGKPVKLKGVNRHEHDPDRGQAITPDSMLLDIMLFKKNNINAVRTCHYPNDPRWYSLCNRYGIYVMDEANLETHFAGNKNDNVISNDPSWQEQYIDRQRRMVLRDRNEPSVVIWSMGNEAGDGPNFKACIDWIHQADTTRSVHYEGSGKEYRAGAPHSDWSSNMYHAPGALAVPGKPYLLCEYSHAMGNSSGNLDLYWKYIYASSQHQGGFIWDWVDQGIRQPVPDGFVDPFGRTNVFAYGGFWGRFYGHEYDKKYGQSRGEFCMNGLVAADRTPHPGLKALKYVYQNIFSQPLNLKAGEILVKNRYDFINSKEMVAGLWDVTCEGKIIAQGAMPELDLEPKTEKTIRLDIPQLCPESGKEYFLNLHYVTKEDTFYAKAGYELAREQFPLDVNIAPADSADWLPKLVVEDCVSTIQVCGDKFTVTFDKSTGGLSSYRMEQTELISTGPVLDLWRALTDNDWGASIKNSRHNSEYKNIASKAVVESIRTDCSNLRAVKVFIRFKFPTGDHFTTDYTVYGNGEVGIEASFTKGSEWSGLFYRVGMSWGLPDDFTSMTWYGRGPDETYSDRKFEPIGVFSGTVEGQWVDYSNPQENGNKVDVRWVAFQNSSGMGLIFKGVQPLSVNASLFAQDDIGKVDYTFELKRRNQVFVNIDLAQQGVGGDNSWGALPHAPYLLPVADYRYSYHFQPIKVGSKSLSEIGRTLTGAKRTFNVVRPEASEADIGDAEVIRTRQTKKNNLY